MNQKSHQNSITVPTIVVIFFGLELTYNNVVQPIKRIPIIGSIQLLGMNSYLIEREQSSLSFIHNLQHNAVEVAAFE